MKKKDKKKICGFCNESYKKIAEEVFFHGKFCLHDEKLVFFKKMHGMPMKNTALSVDIAGSGKDIREKKYIESNKRKGNTVVRGSDGLLRAIGTN